MQEHPITTSILHKGLGSLLLLLAIAIQCALLTLYGDLPLSITLIDSLLSIALFAVAGYYLWYVQCTLHIILSQWYASRERKSEAEPIVRQMEEKTAPPPTTVPEEILDRISVKDGARIHIIPIKEIFYLQACGDYVTLFTTSGQHVKEQTMKYFERSLPSPEFVRIHRSYIVNTEQILRVELFGKETYQVRLKDGTYLRASSAGYKLLKERLSL